MLGGSSLNSYITELKEHYRRESTENIILKRRKESTVSSIRKQPERLVEEQQKVYQQDRFERDWRRLGDDCEGEGTCGIGFSISRSEPTHMRNVLGNHVRGCQDTAQFNQTIEAILIRIENGRNGELHEAFSDLQGILADTDSNYSFLSKEARQSIFSLLLKSYLSPIHTQQTLEDAVGALIGIQKYKVQEPHQAITALKSLASTLPRACSAWILTGISHCVGTYLTRFGYSHIEQIEQFSLEIADMLLVLKSSLKNVRSERLSYTIEEDKELQTSLAEQLVCHESIAQSCALWILKVFDGRENNPVFVQKAGQLINQVLLPFCFSCFEESFLLKDTSPELANCPWRRGIFDWRKNGDTCRMVVSRALQQGLECPDIFSELDPADISQLLEFALKVAKTVPGLESVLLSLVTNLSAMDRLQMLSVLMQHDFVASTCDACRIYVFCAARSADSHELLADRLLILTNAFIGAETDYLRRFAASYLVTVFDSIRVVLQATLEVKSDQGAAKLSSLCIRLIRCLLLNLDQDTSEQILRIHLSFLEELISKCVGLEENRNALFEMILLTRTVLEIDQNCQGEEPTILDRWESNGCLDGLADTVNQARFRSTKCQQAWKSLQAVFRQSAPVEFGDRDFLDN